MKSFTFYAILLTIAALINLAGYVFGLWHERTGFDEFVHLYTTFALVAAMGFVLARRAGEKPNVPTLLASGVILGLAWEAFELTIGIIGSRRDTLVDLGMDLLGAVLASALVRRGDFRRASGTSI